MSEFAALPPALPEFASIRRAWDPDLRLSVARLAPGQYYVTRFDEAIFTVLGSCVSACIRDVRNGVGGMNHFMLPIDHSRGKSAWQNGAGNSPARFGDVAMARLIKSILQAGGQREHLEAKLFGGGKVLDMSLDVGARNAEFARGYVRDHGLALAGTDLGGGVARKIYYSPLSGVARVKHLAGSLGSHRSRAIAAPGARDGCRVFLHGENLLVKAPIKVLVVDDSAVMRHLLTEILSSDSAIQVVGSAADPYIARDKIKALNPDVLTLDVEMPRMDGLTFLRNLMRLRPMPVVMCSSLTQQGADVTLDALSLGAVDYVSKPGIDAARGLQDAAQEIIEKVKIAAKARVRPLDERASERVRVRSASISSYQTTDSIIAIGASTGGTEAIKAVLMDLPADVPGIVVVQHIPRAFSGRFAKRLDGLCGLSVSEAEDGQVILPGHAYIAPGDQHLLVKRDGARYRCELSDTARVNCHRPAADVLFESVAEAVGRNAIAVLLTGMGNDGARGMLAMRNAGARTLVQDEYTSVVWGMPGAAWELGAAESQHALAEIPAQIMRLLSGSETLPKAMGAT